MPINFDPTKVTANVKKAAMTGIVRVTEEIKTDAVMAIMQGAKTGRKYRRRGVVHQASGPGEAPASDTGRLVNSINTTYDEEQLVGRVNVSTEYGAPLEFGTVKMAPRPFLRPAMAKHRKDATVEVSLEVQKALK